MSDSFNAQFIPSPCVSVCALDEDDVCVGCYRTGMEISQWGRLAISLQRQVVECCHKRMRGELAACVVARLKMEGKR